MPFLQRHIILLGTPGFGPFDATIVQALFDMDIDYNIEVCHAGYSQLAAAPAMMIPTVTYVGMIVAHDMGARSFLPPAMVIGGSLMLVFAGSYV